MGSARDPGRYVSAEHRERWKCNPGRVVLPRLRRWFFVTEGTSKRASGRNCFGFRVSDGGNRYFDRDRELRGRFINNAAVSYDVS